MPESRDEAAGARRWEGFDLLRLAAGALLLVAALLKMRQLLTPAIPDNRAWHILQVEVELVLGLWLIGGIYRLAAWVAAVGFFTVAAAVSLWGLLRGNASCGCFGELQVHPAITLALDVLVLAALLLCPPAASRQTGRRILAIVAMIAVATALSGSAMARYRPGLLLADGRIEGDARHVLLRPETWVNQPFPLLPYMDLGPELQTGRWSLLFFSHYCPVCHEVVEKLLADAPGHPDRAAVARTVLVEVAPSPLSARENERIRQHFKLDRLKPAHNWYIDVPTVVQIEDGRVTLARRWARLELPPVKPATRPHSPASAPAAGAAGRSE